MPLQGTSGAASQDAFGGNGVAVVPAYIEDVFSTFLYTGNNSTQTITNGIDLSTKGGLVWIKSRSEAGSDHGLTDTVRGATKSLLSNQTYSELTGAADLTSFNTTGFSIGAGTQFSINTNNSTYVSWTFRKQPKFFDIVTYTGTGSARTVAHNLGSVPACIIVKKTSNADNWAVYHRSLTATDRILLNTTGATAAGSAYWNNTEPTASVFTVNTVGATNEAGETYVAYLFAHDAGGFGLTGTDNVISCGSYTGTGAAGNNVTLGYEPQWLLIKQTNTTGAWVLIDIMRGFPVGGSDQWLYANLSNAEATVTSTWGPTATGFVSNGATLNTSAATYIYIAIRRGPMKVPTTGTSVFSPIASSDTQGTQQTTGFPVDLQIAAYRPSTLSNNSTANDRLRGVSSTSTGNTSTPLVTSSTAAETAGGIGTQGWNNTGFGIPAFLSSSSSIYWNFRRAPSFFDEVCDTGTGVAKTVTHNLGVIPELVIRKSRSNSGPYWLVGSSYLSFANDEYLQLSTTGAVSAGGGSYWNSTAPTSSVFSVGSNSYSNGSGYTFVTYLFATCAGVSKVGSYTGTGTTLQIDCGFTAGARFVLIKRTDSTGAWYVWDTARGIVSGNDPYLLLNSTAAEVTSTDYIDTYSAGFEISSTAPAAINANGGTYIFLAIA